LYLKEKSLADGEKGVQIIGEYFFDISVADDRLANCMNINGVKR
jgi:hypothetical protein